MVLFAPITTPWFIFKSRKASGIILFIVFLMTFAAVGGTEFFLYTKYMEKNRYSNLSPVIQQMMHLTEDLKASTVEFDKALVKLAGLSKVDSRIHEIKNTIDFIYEVRDMEAVNKNAILRIDNYLYDYKSFFAKKDLLWLFKIQEFYDNHNVVQHYKSMKTYIDSFEDLLRYTHINFSHIKNLKTQKYLQNYDQYYLRYRRAVDSHNRFNEKRIDFQNKFIKKYPKVTPCLPGKRQIETFKFWG